MRCCLPFAMQGGDMVKVVAAGFSCADVYEKLRKFYPTGNGVDWGVHLSRLGIPVSLVSVVGTDSYGASMKAALLKEGIDVSHLHIEAGDTCKMMMDLRNGTDRVHLEEIEGVMAEFSLSEDDIEFICTHDYLHTDLFGKILHMLPEFHRRGIKIVMDFSIFSADPEYCDKDIFQYVDYAFLSYEKDDDYIREWIKTIQSKGPRIVTATLGENGSLSWDGQKYYRKGIIPVDVVNTVGAGDSFIAGFTYGLIRGMPIPACMEQGTRLSAKVISKFEPY